MISKAISIVELRQNEINTVSGGDISLRAQIIALGVVVGSVGLLSSATAMNKVLFNGFATGMAYCYFLEPNNLQPQNILKKAAAGTMAAGLKELADRAPLYTQILLSGLLAFLVYKNVLERQA